MRTWLLILMIALLPLRGWAAGAMALSMQSSPVTVHAMAPCHGGDTAMQPAAADMDNHHGGAAHLASADSGHDGSLVHNTCTACDLCNGPALTQASAFVRSAWPVTTPLSTGHERFVSALAQRSHKPPIA